MPRDRALYAGEFGVPAGPDEPPALLESRPRRLALVALIIGAGIGITLFGPWEMDGETWGYWYFARLVNETGLLSAWDRSPLYILYLSAFSRLGYPASVVAEYVVTSAIFCASFVSLFYRTRLAVPAAVASVIMLAVAWSSPPNCQILALSCTFFAFACLIAPRKSTVHVALGVFFMALAYLFRSTYVVVPLVVLPYLLFLDSSAAAGFWNRVRSLALAAVPAVMFLAGLYLFSRSHQIEHAWNNVFMASAHWFPVNIASLLDSGFVSHMNWIYIAEQYPQAKGIDFYRTNQELFQGATTAREAVMANPRFVVHGLFQNVLTAFETLARLTTLPLFFHKIGLSSRFVTVALGMCVAMMIAAISFGRHFRVELRLMFIALTAAALTSILSMPKFRYFVCVTPILFFVAVRVIDFIESPGGPGRAGRLAGYLDRSIVRRLGYGTSVVLVFVLLSYGTLMAYLAARAPQRGGAVLEGVSGSMKASHPALLAMSRGCKGIMALEHTYFGAFVAPGGARVYDVFEIPPFGKFETGSYRGLDPDRIDCLFVSHGLISGESIGTDTFGRYNNYIKPYEDALLSRGAARSEIPGYGYAVRLGGV